MTGGHLSRSLFEWPLEQEQGASLAAPSGQTLGESKEPYLASSYIALGAYLTRAAT